MNGSPIIVMIFGHFLLDDKFTILRGFTAILLVAGIILNALPEDFNTISAEVTFYELFEHLMLIFFV